MARARDAGLWLALALLFPASAQAIDPTLCDDDGVTEIPDFAEGRDANQCLMIDPGNGDPAIPFQYELFHQRGLSASARDSGEVLAGGTSDAGHTWSSEWIEPFRKDLGGCPTKTSGKYCSFIWWDLFLDNFLSPAGKNDDVATIGNYGMEYLLIKDSVLANGWKCSGGPAWSGPNGIGCSSGEDSSAHSDGLQMRGTLVNGGWMVVQDSKVVNSHISLMQLGGQSSGFQPQRTNIVFQGFELGTRQQIGEATHWIDDCYARGATDACEGNRSLIGFTADEFWMIDVYGNARMAMIGDYQKVVNVNTGCGMNGCDGNITYDQNGWPHPMVGQSGGPGTCPNGLMPGKCVGRDGSVGACFCYTSLENALNDTVTSTSGLGDCPAPYCPHKQPPFVNMSATGWENPPDGTSPRPRPVNLLP
jgi:hypothetical protein